MWLELFAARGLRAAPTRDRYTQITIGQFQVVSGLSKYLGTSPALSINLQSACRRGRYTSQENNTL